MKTRVPLYAKILAWFFLNLTAVVAVSWWLLRDQFRFSALPARVAGDQVEKTAEAILADAFQRPVNEWNEILAEYQRRHRVEFRILSGSGRPVAGSRDPLPPEVHSRVFGFPRDEPPPPEAEGEFGPRRGRPPPPFPGGPRRGGPPSGPEGGPPPPPPFSEEMEIGGGPPNVTLENLPQKVVVESKNPDRYWVIVHANKVHPAFRNGAFVIASSDSVTGHGFFFDVRPYVWWGIGVLALSVAIWFPFVRSVTRSLSRMRNATAALAEGKFDAEVDELRRDEVGELGAAINRMARRLEGYVGGQKRFLGDVAHELSAPAARLQMAVSIMEQRATTDAERERLADVREEVEHIGSLVNELLQFSRASVTGRQVEVQPVNIRAVVEKAARREAGDISQLRNEIAEEFQVMADPDLLLRAISNLLRNAIRYAGHAGPITVSAGVTGSTVALSVRDKGPGVPKEALPRLFEPFYRVDDARTPGSSGAGLGLAIVQTCVDACNGSVSARNLAPVGFEVTIHIPIAHRRE